MGMFFMEPAFLVFSVTASLTFYLVLFKGKQWKYLCSVAFLGILITFINPFFNTNGERVLFTLFFGQKYTWEGLCYGIKTGAMFFTILLWFSCYNAIMGSDKFLYLFGRISPALSLLLSMVFRLVPGLNKKIERVSATRRALGNQALKGKKEKLKESMTVFLVVAGCALEEAVETADSMKSRGYGTGKRNCFSIYRWHKRDVAAGLTMLCCVVFVAMGVCFDTLEMVGVTGYGLFLFIPTVIQMGEEITWHILQSRI